MCYFRHHFKHINLNYTDTTKFYPFPKSSTWWFAKELTLSVSKGTVCMGMGCHWISEFQSCRDCGGYIPARSVAALIRVRSRSVLRT